MNVSSVAEAVAENVFVAILGTAFVIVALCFTQGLEAVEEEQRGSLREMRRGIKAAPTRRHRALGYLCLGFLLVSAGADHIAEVLARGLPERDTQDTAGEDAP